MRERGKLVGGFQTAPTAHTETDRESDVSALWVYYKALCRVLKLCGACLTSGPLVYRTWDRARSKLPDAVWCSSYLWTSRAINIYVPSLVNDKKFDLQSFSNNLKNNMRFRNTIKYQSFSLYGEKKNALGFFSESTHSI